MGPYPSTCEKVVADTSYLYHRGDIVDYMKKGDTLYYHCYKKQNGNYVEISDLPDDAAEKERFLTERKITVTKSDTPEQHLSCTARGIDGKLCSQTEFVQFPWPNTF